MKIKPRHLHILVSAWLACGIFLLGVPLVAYAHTSSTDKPTIILVHGAFADSSSWSGVITGLQQHGYTVVAAPDELRSVKGDAAAVSSLIKTIPGPVVLVGHSYGGSVISEAAAGLDQVKALVFVAAFAPEVGETSADLAGRFPGSTLGPALAPPVPLPGGGNDLYIVQSKFRAQFAADVPVARATLMAAEQRPITVEALHEPITIAAWKAIPTWFIYGTADLNIPPAAHAFMAERAQSRKTVVIEGASHVLMVSHPADVASLIEQAAQAK